MAEGMEGERMQITAEMIQPQKMNLRDFRPFKTSEEYLWAMKEDLSEWLNSLYPRLEINADNFMERLDTGVVLCQHASRVHQAMQEWVRRGEKLPKCWGKEWKIPSNEVVYRNSATRGTFFARDNVHNFISWCKQIGIFDCLLFETEDLISRKNEKNVILCLLEVARRGSQFGMTAPLLIQYEKEIDKDIAKDNGQNISSSEGEEDVSIEYGPAPQRVTNDLKSLDEMVRDLVAMCTCPTQFPMVRVANGKYRVGDKSLIYVRILRNHVMVRVGGGWDTLAHYLDKHDPCRCSSGHRTTISSKLILKNEGKNPQMRVEYERGDRSYLDTIISSTPTKRCVDSSDTSSELSDEGYKSPLGNLNCSLQRDDQTTRPSSVSEEERPDSRSTDDDSFQNSSPPVSKTLSPFVVKSSSSSGTSRGAHNRSISCDRTSSRSSRNTVRSNTPNGRLYQPPQKEGVSARKTKVGNAHVTPERSQSASGSEFYSPKLASGSAGGSVRMAKFHKNNKIWKNTWSGGTSHKRATIINDGRFVSKPPQENNVLGDKSDIQCELTKVLEKAILMTTPDETMKLIERGIEDLKRMNPQASIQFHDHSNLPYDLLKNGKLSYRRRKNEGSTKIPYPIFS